MDGTRSVQLASGSTRWLEAKLVEYLLHGDLGAKRIEGDTWHDLLVSFRPSLTGYREEAPVLLDCDCVAY
jgi:hypothetical protein